ncbi:MAG: ATP phosphoribosyltransferase regulatory subunit, partial [Syntrophobacterales bacterium]
DLRLLINSLGCPDCTGDFKDRLQLFLNSREGWCDDCQRRRITNPLRVLDCKSKTCQELLAEAPVMEDSLCEACNAHYTRVLSLLDGAGVAYEKNPRLVRGLDYYTRTAFEVTAAGLGAQDAVAGGGRYNSLARELGGPDLPALGFAIGEDRLLEVLPQEAGPADKAMVFLAALGDAAKERAFFLLQEIRGQGLPAAMDFEGRSLKAQMSLADRLGANFVVIIGDQELAAGEAPLRRMASGEQEVLPLAELVPALTLLAKGKEGN